jgi:hypothetical protein
MVGYPINEDRQHFLGENSGCAPLDQIIKPARLFLARAH